MHMAISEKLSRELRILEKDRFFIGQILPDAVRGERKKTAGSHYDRLIAEGTRKIMDFHEFYLQYSERVRTDVLYLGYYFHLIQDCLFRQFLYYELGFLHERGKREFIETLYKDYHNINGYLVRMYGLPKELKVPKGFEQEEIHNICAFDLKGFLADMKKDYQDADLGNNRFLMISDAERYINRCVRVCEREFEALQRKGAEISPYQYAWEILK